MTKIIKVKFKNYQELYEWLSKGKPVKIGEYTSLPNKDGLYPFSLDEDINIFTGIETVETKKAYAFSHGGQIKHFEDPTGFCSDYIRCPEFDLEAKELIYL